MCSLANVSAIASVYIRRILYRSWCHIVREFLRLAGPLYYCHYFRKVLMSYAVRRAKGRSLRRSSLPTNGATMLI